MEEDFEAWEDHYELHEREDYPGLVSLCEREVARRPGDLHALGRLGEAYVLNGRHLKAVERMGQCHQQHPDIDAFQAIILDALFAMGKTEDDYPWKSRPEILRIGPEVANLCYRYLQPKRKPRSAGDLHDELTGKGYLAFSEDDLLACLRKDTRFEVDADTHWQCGISVKRKTRRRRNRP